MIRDPLTINPWSPKGNDHLLMVQKAGGYYRFQKNNTELDHILSRKLPEITSPKGRN